MLKAIWNGAVLAESDRYEVVEGNYYFPPDSINWQYFKESEMHTLCPWKGVASYHDIVVQGKVNKGAAWYYPSPSKAAKRIKNYVAFWRGVKVETSSPSITSAQKRRGSLISTIRSAFAPAHQESSEKQ